MLEQGVYRQEELETVPLVMPSREAPGGNEAAEL